MHRLPGPSVDEVHCHGCGLSIDPLRTKHIAMFDHAIAYFCARACRGPRTAASFKTSETSGLNAASEPRAAVSPFQVEDEPELVEPLSDEIEDRTELVAEALPPPPLLITLALGAGLISTLLSIAPATPTLVAARILTATLGGALLSVKTFVVPDADEPKLLVSISALGTATVVSAVALATGRLTVASDAALVSSLLVALLASSRLVLDWIRSRVISEKENVRLGLSSGTRLTSVLNDARPAKVRVGEVFTAEAAGMVLADGVIVEGEADVYPWMFAKTRVRRGIGHGILAGAKVLRGRLRIQCTNAGMDVSYARLLLNPKGRVDQESKVARVAHFLSDYGGAALFVLVFVVMLLGHRGGYQAAIAAAAVAGSVGTFVTREGPSVFALRGILLALRRGIVFENGNAWEKAADVRAAAFSLRGTLLMGEPELREVESLNASFNTDSILALAASATAGEEDSLSQGIQRGVAARAIRLEAIRNKSRAPGLGVTAIAPNGEQLLVGSRALMLEHRISIASAERRIEELEQKGRSIVLLSIGSRAVGLLALQDGLRPLARAAIEQLASARIEPILLSQDSQKTCEGVARSLDVEHVFAELSAKDRAREISRISQAGTKIAVFGRLPEDADAFSAGHVSIALDAAGRKNSVSISTASNSIRDAALALTLSHQSRSDARLSLALSVAPALLGGVVVMLGILPAAFAPIAAALGMLACAAHNGAIDSRSFDPIDEAD